MPITDNWHFSIIAAKLQHELERISDGRPRTKHLIINMPPRSGKSLISSILMPAWGWLIDPSLKFISTSYSSSLSTNHNRFCRNVVESQWYRSFSEIEIAPDQNQKGYFENTSGGFRMGTSVGGAILGSGADVIIMDDILKPDQALSEVERTNANTYFDETVSTRLNNPDVGMYIIISQRLHEDDIVGHVLDKIPGQWEHINIPATLNINTTKEYAGYYEDDLFFPKRFSLQTLQNLKRILGSYAYSAQFDQEPVDLKGGMVKKDWLTIVNYQHPDYKEIMKQPMNFVIDSAYTKKEENDPSGILAYRVYKSNVYIFNRMVERLEFPALLKKIKVWTTANAANNKSRIYIENKASGISLVQMVRANTDLNAIEYKQTTQDKISRLNDILPELEAGKCFLMEGAWNEEFIKQVITFPKAKHDEDVDCLVMMMNKKNSGNYSIR
jgi:predicted phage terminase large subunit-like protein